MSVVSERLKICFAILPQSPELRDYTEQVFEFIITEAAEHFDYKPVRADQVADNAISPQVIQHLSQDGLVLADLTGQNPQVFYGLAVRHATRKPVIHLLREDEPAVAEFPGMPTLHVSISSARSVKRCKQELITFIENIERASDLQDNPISRALKRQVLEQSETLLDQRAAEMLKQLSAIRGTVGGLDERLSQPESIIPPEIFRLLEGIRQTVSALDDRLAQPENILPPEHMMNVIKNSGMMLNREDVDRLMNDIFGYAEDAKNTLLAMHPQLGKLSKGLNNVVNTLNKQQDPANPPDLGSLAGQIDESVSGIKQSQDTINEAIQKLDGSLGTLSQLYRNLSKLTL
jgi:hypothetical protein